MVLLYKDIKCLYDQPKKIEEINNTFQLDIQNYRKLYKTMLSQEDFLKSNYHNNGFLISTTNWFD